MSRYLSGYQNQVYERRMPVKGSRASAPEVTPNSLTGTLHRGLAVRSHLQAATLNFSAALHFIADIYRKMYHFLPWREIFILVVWAVYKYIIEGGVVAGRQ